VSLEPAEHDDLPPRPLTAVERLLLALGIVALGVVCLVVTYTVIARAAGLPLIPDDVQIVQQIMVIVIIFPMAAVTAVRMHIVVTIFSKWMPARTRAHFIAFGDVIGLLLVTILLIGAIRLFLDSFASGEYYDGDIRIPYWMAHGAYAVALAALWLRMAALAFVDFAAARAQPSGP
jgi:TRAP-type C4-dicarboxylate transport system permease small subunit